MVGVIDRGHTEIERATNKGDKQDDAKLRGHFCAQRDSIQVGLHLNYGEARGAEVVITPTAHRMGSARI